MMTEKNNDIFAIYCFFQYFCRNKKLFVTIKFIKGIMKINKTIIVSIVGLMTSAGAFGENNSMPDRTDVKDFCSVISLYDKTGDSEPFVHFVTTLWPKLNTVNGREALVRIHQLAMKESYGKGVASAGKEDTLAQLLELLSKLGFTGADLTQMLEYMEKVYPLYVFQIENRVRPSVDYDNGLVVDTIYQAPVDEAYYGLANEKNKYVPTGLSVQELKRWRAMADAASATVRTYGEWVHTKTSSFGLPTTTISACKAMAISYSRAWATMFHTRTVAGHVNTDSQLMQRKPIPMAMRTASMPIYVRHACTATIRNRASSPT